MSHPLEDRFRAALAARPDAVPADSRVLLAFSGGSDSTALLHLLGAVEDELRLELRAAHFDHGLRAGSADEAERAAAACREAGIACRVERASGLTRSQAACRSARYDFLRREAGRVVADRIALAHQRDDQLETVLHRLVRGTGLRGLAGIPDRRGRFVRPLLPFGRAELRSYLRDLDVSWISDPANEDPHYARARIRHVLLPGLGAASGGAAAGALAALASAARVADAGLERRAGRRAAEALVAEESASGAQIARSKLLGYDRAERARVLRKLARDQGFRLGRRGTEAAVAFVEAGASGRGVDVAGGLRVWREYDRIVIGPPRERRADRELEIVGPGAGRREVRLGGRIYTVRWGPAGTEGERTAELALPALCFPLRVRGPRPGDRIRTRVGSRKLKKLLNERRVPRSARPTVPVLVGADDRVLWVAGHEVAADGRPRPDEEMLTIAIGEY